MANLLRRAYNPDVLTCLANLSNDEVFTPPELANQVLDLLPKELWSDPSVKILDPFCKSGVFLREAAKRFIKGLEPIYPDLQERVDHIMREQLFGIAITELTSLLSRRSLYCSKFPNGRFSVSEFDGEEGNIRYRNIQHTWSSGKCVYCGASQSQYDRDKDLETHAYEFIHTHHPEEIFDMKFDVIVGNPPYQLDTGGSGRQAKPIYNLFVEQAKKLHPRHLVMIIPSRWFAGGMGMDSFRSSMMEDRHITQIVDYANAKDCFPQNSISGGVCYFLRERDREDDCLFVNASGSIRTEQRRSLSEFPVLVRYNRAVETLRKVTALSEPTLSSMVSSISPYGLPTSVRGSSQPTSGSDVRLLSSGGMSYLHRSEVNEDKPCFNDYKVAVSQTGAEHACEPDKNGQFRVLTSSMRILQPTDVCTHSYLVVGPVRDEVESENLLDYLKTKFVRFLVLQAVSSIHISRQTFCFVPVQDFSRAWSDAELFEKYGLSADEIAFIEEKIKPFETDDSND